MIETDVPEVMNCANGVRVFFLLLTLMLSIAAVADGTAGNPGEGDPPNLVVQITVDQMRGDHLQRLAPMFTGGFRRLLDEGRVYTRATVDHATTSSFPGHVTLSTGMHPRNHGIPERVWIFQEEAGALQAGGIFEGIQHSVPGQPELSSGGAEKVIAGSLAEWMAATYPAGRFAAISGGEFASLLHAVHRRGHVYWYMAEAQGLVTSDYYRDAIPDWVMEAGETVFTGIEDEPVWRLSVPETYHHLARRDRAYYETDGDDTVFPHGHDAAGDASLAEWVYGVPLLDDMTFAVVDRAVDELELGQGVRTDFLSIVASATDSVGHRWGPRSLEQLDTLYRLDRHLGRLFDKLDRLVGRTNYVVALSADHGVSNAPAWDLENGKYAVRLTDDVYESFIDRAAGIAAAHDGPEEALKAHLMRALKAHPLVADTIDISAVLGNPQQDPLLRLYHNAAGPERIFVSENMSGSLSMEGHPLQHGVGIRFVEGASVGSLHIPGIHGSPYFHDRHVVLAFWGAGIEPGRLDADAGTVDVAPTLACLAGVVPPDGLDGRILFGDERCRR